MEPFSETVLNHPTPEWEASPMPTQHRLSTPLSSHPACCGPHFDENTTNRRSWQMLAFSAACDRLAFSARYRRFVALLSRCRLEKITSGQNLSNEPPFPDAHSKTPARRPYNH